MSNDYRRIIGAELNAMRHSLGALVGIAQGLLCDGILTDDEILYLRKWLTENERLCYGFPGDVIYDQVKGVLADGVVTEDERSHLIKILNNLIGAPETAVAAAARVTELAYDDVTSIDFGNKLFCLTGDFVHGPRPKCEADIRERGGLTSSNVTQKLSYLVIGSLGSVEWKHGSFGLKIEKAMQYKQKRRPIYVIKETIWRQALAR